MPSGTALAVAALVALTYIGGHAVVKKIGPPIKRVAVVATQPIRHPKKDMKAVGSHLFHFFKGDR